MSILDPRRRSPIVKALCATGLLLPLLTACSPKESDDGFIDLPVVSASPAVSKSIHLWDEFNGRVEAIQHVSLIPRVSGYIEKINFIEGQVVKKGDILFTIDARDYQAALQSASAELARARARAELATSEAVRAKRLVDQQATSTEIHEQRSSAASQAQADVRAAEAAEAQARLNLERTQVRSPIDGRAGRARFTVGNLVSADDSASVLTSVVSQDKVYVYFDADEAVYRRYLEAAQATGGMNNLAVRVRLVGETGYPHTGTVNFFDNQLSRTTGTINVRAALDNASGMFTPGMFARVQLRRPDEVQALLIDEKGVMTDQDRKYVFVVDNDGTTHRRDVVLGGTSEGLRIITDGLKAGDTVVVGGTQRIVTPGTKVRIQSDAETPAGQSDVKVSLN